MTRIPLSQVVDRLQAHYGQPKVLTLGGPWEMILWQNVAYLVCDLICEIVFLCAGDDVRGAVAVDIAGRDVHAIRLARGVSVETLQ